MNAKEKILLRTMAKNQFEIMNMFERLFSLLWETEDAALQILNEDEALATDKKAEDVTAERAEEEPKSKATGVCVICGKEFEKKTNNQKCCSPACTEEKNRRYQLERYKKAKKKSAEAKQTEDLTSPITEHKKKLSVAECQRIDAEHGVSYGIGELMGLHVKK